jgi:hypothetical protein
MILFKNLVIKEKRRAMEKYHSSASLAVRKGEELSWDKKFSKVLIALRPYISLDIIFSIEPLKKSVLS